WAAHQAGQKLVVVPRQRQRDVIRDDTPSRWIPDADERTQPNFQAFRRGHRVTTAVAEGVFEAAAERRIVVKAGDRHFSSRAILPRALYEVHENTRGDPAVSSNSCFQRTEGQVRVEEDLEAAA